MNKKLAIVLVLIGLLLLGSGIVLFTLNAKETQPKPNNAEEQETAQEPTEEVKENNNEFIKEEHCLQTICIETITIKKDATTNQISVTGEFTNKGTAVEPAGYIKFLVIHEGKEFYKLIQYPEIQPNAKVPINFLAEDKDNILLYAMDYTLVEPTQTEIAEANQ